MDDMREFVFRVKEVVCIFDVIQIRMRSNSSMYIPEQVYGVIRPNPPHHDDSPDCNEDCRRHPHPLLPSLLGISLYTIINFLQ